MQNAGERIEAGTRVSINDDWFTFGIDIMEFRESNDLLHDVPALRERMVEDGFLFFRGFFDRERVLAARRRVLRHVEKLGCLKPGTDPDAGVIGEGNRSLGLFRDLEIAHSPEVLGVVDSPAIFDFFTDFLGGEILTFDKRWLRATARGGSSGWQYDSVYMNRGTKNLYTCWTPLGDVPLAQGPLALCLGSHWLERVKETYGMIDIDRDHVEPHFTEEPRELIEKFRCHLATTNFHAGDALLFGISMMHATLPNTTDQYRLSIDTRYQLVAEPVDERFMGANGTWKGSYSFHNPAPRKPMKELRAGWGV
jgi:hypothetical protein